MKVLHLNPPGGVERIELVPKAHGGMRQSTATRGSIIPAALGTDTRGTGGGIGDWGQGLVVLTLLPSFPFPHPTPISLHLFFLLPFRSFFELCVLMIPEAEWGCPVTPSGRWFRAEESATEFHLMICDVSSNTSRKQGIPL